MKSQSISTRLLKVLLMGFVLAALLMSFKVSASAREKIYPSSYSNTILSKGFTYKLGSWSPSYYSFRSTNPSVAKVTKNGVIIAKKKGSCHINVYNKYTGKWVIGYPVRVRKNRYYGPSYSAVRVGNYNYGTYMTLLSGYTKGKYAVLNFAIVNNRILRIKKITSASFRISIGGTTLVSKGIGKRNIKVGRYSKKRMTVKLKLSKGQRKKLDWNRMYLKYSFWYQLVY